MYGLFHTQNVSVESVYGPNVSCMREMRVVFCYISVGSLQHAHWICFVLVGGPLGREGLVCLTSLT